MRAESCVAGARDAQELDQAERFKIVEDFERGRSQVIYTFTMKLAHWLEEPWSLFAVAHQDSGTAIAAFEKALASKSQHPAVTALPEPGLLQEVCVCLLRGPVVLDLSGWNRVETLAGVHC